jgi:hypothetical protein
MKCEILRPDSSTDKDSNILWYDAVWIGKQAPSFWRTPTATGTSNPMNA